MKFQDGDRPWERQPRESEEAFAAWLRYRDLGEKRSLELVARGATKSLPTLKTYSARWGWVERARSWDNHVLLERDKARAKYHALNERRRIKTLEVNYGVAQALREKALRMLAWPLKVEEVEKDGKAIHVHPSKWQMSTVVDFLKLAAEIESAVLTAASPPLSECSELELMAMAAAADQGIREVVPEANDEGATEAS